MARPSRASPSWQWSGQRSRLPVAGLQDHAAVEMRHGEVRPYGERGVEGGDGLGQAPELAQHDGRNNADVGTFIIDAIGWDL